MYILDRKDLREAVGGTVLGAVAIGIARYFKSDIEIYFGETVTNVLLGIVVVLYGLQVSSVIAGWLFVREGERLEREEEAADKRQQEEHEREEKEQEAEWEAFTNWVKQNAVTAERLMLIVESEQIENPEYRAWIAERRETEGPNILTDLPRLFNWLKAKRDLKKTGLDSGLPPWA